MFMCVVYRTAERALPVTTAMPETLPTARFRLQARFSSAWSTSTRQECWKLASRTAVTSLSQIPGEIAQTRMS